MQTIPRNATFKIRGILEQAALILEWNQEASAVRCSVDDVMEAIRNHGASRVVNDRAVCLRVDIHANWWFRAYPSADVARSQLAESCWERYGLAPVENHNETL